MGYLNLTVAYLTAITYMCRLHDKGAVTNSISQHSLCLCVFFPSHLQLVNCTHLLFHHPRPPQFIKGLALQSVDCCFNTSGPFDGESYSSCSFSLDVLHSLLPSVLMSLVHAALSSAIGQASFLLYLCSLQSTIIVSPPKPPAHLLKVVYICVDIALNWFYLCR